MSNFLSPINFQLIIDKTPNVCDTTQRVSIPGSSLGSAEQSSPFVPINNPGNIKYNTLDIMFKVQENLQNYIEIHSWLEELGTPDSLSDYMRDSQDARVLLLNSNRRPNISITFTNIQPTYLSDLNLDSTLEDVQYIDLSASFKFDRYFFEVL